MDTYMEDTIFGLEMSIKNMQDRVAYYTQRRAVAGREMWATLDSLIEQDTAGIAQAQAKVKALRDGTYTIVVWNGPGWYLPMQRFGATFFYYRDYPKYVVPNEPGMGTPSWLDTQPDWATEIQDYREMAD